MKKLALFLSLFVILFLFPRSALAATITLTPVDDTFVSGRASNVNTNFSSSSSISIGTHLDGGKFYGIYKFDFSSIPTTASINSATLRIYQTSNSWSGAGANFGIYRITGDWAGNTVTWNDRPSSVSTLSSSSGVNTSTGYKEWEVTELVQDFVDGTYPNKGFYLSPTNSVVFIALFGSSEAASNKPQLVVDYTNMLLLKPGLINPGILHVIDLTAPTISNIQVSWNIDIAQVSWLTNEVSDSFLDYGETATYGQTVGKSESVTEHKVDISGLKYSTTYHYHVKSKDSNGNLATSGDATFTTPEEPTEKVAVVDQTPAGTGSTSPASSVNVSTGTSGAAGSVETNGGTGTETKESVGGSSAELLGKILPIALGGILVAIILTILALVKAAKGGRVPVVPVTQVKKKKAVVKKEETEEEGAEEGK